MLGERVKIIYADAVREALSVVIQFGLLFGVENENILKKIKEDMSANKHFWFVVAQIIFLRCESEGIAEEERNKMIGQFIDTKYFDEVIDIIKGNDKFAKSQMEILSAEIKLSQVKEIEGEVITENKITKSIVDEAEKITFLFEQGKTSEKEAIKKFETLIDEAKNGIKKLDERLEFLKKLKDSI